MMAARGMSKRIGLVSLFSYDMPHLRRCSILFDDIEVSFAKNFIDINRGNPHGDPYQADELEWLLEKGLVSYGGVENFKQALDNLENVSKILLSSEIDQKSKDNWIKDFQTLEEAERRRVGGWYDFLSCEDKDVNCKNWSDLKGRNIERMVVYLQKLQWDMDEMYLRLMARARSMLDESGYVVPAIQYSSGTWNNNTSDEVWRVIIKNLPMPDDDVPWEKL